MAVGENIRNLRKAFGWSLRKLAAESDVSFSTIDKIELGRNKHLDYYQISRIALAFGVTVEQLIGEKQ